jgi:hypothetical protein
MKIAILGGTGSLGAGLALRLSRRHEVMIGSRSAEKADRIAAELSASAGVRIVGGTSLQVADACEAAILAVSYDPGQAFLKSLAEPLSGKLVLSPVVPMKLEAGMFYYSKEDGSAAESVAALLKKSAVAAAFHTIPAPLLLKTGAPLDLDVAVAADSRTTFEAAAFVVSSIDGLRPLYAGPLSTARMLEGLVPLLLNIAKQNRLHNLSVKFV